MYTIYIYIYIYINYIYIDVEELHQWHVDKCTAHPYFERVPDEEGKYTICTCPIYIYDDNIHSVVLNAYYIILFAVLVICICNIHHAIIR